MRFWLVAQIRIRGRPRNGTGLTTHTKAAVVIKRTVPFLDVFDVVRISFCGTLKSQPIIKCYARSSGSRVFIRSAGLSPSHRPQCLRFLALGRGISRLLEVSHPIVKLMSRSLAESVVWQTRAHKSRCRTFVLPSRLQVACGVCCPNEVSKHSYQAHKFLGPHASRQ